MVLFTQYKTMCLSPISSHCIVVIALPVKMLICVQQLHAAKRLLP